MRRRRKTGGREVAEHKIQASAGVIVEVTRACGGAGGGGGGAGMDTIILRCFDGQAIVIGHVPPAAHFDGPSVTPYIKNTFYLNH